MSERRLFIEVTSIDARRSELQGPPGAVALLYRKGGVLCVGPNMGALVDAVFGYDLQPDNRRWLAGNLTSAAARAYPDGVHLWPFSSHVMLWARIDGRIDADEGAS